MPISFQTPWCTSALTWFARAAFRSSGASPKLRRVQPANSSGAIDANAGEGQPLPSPSTSGHPAREVAAQVVRRVGHQHEVREVRRRQRCRSCANRIIGPDVAVDDQERLRPEQRQRVQDAAAGLERLRALLAVLDLAGRTASPSPSAARIWSPSQERLTTTSLNPARDQCPQVMHDQRLAADLQQRFRALESSADACARPGPQPGSWLSRAREPAMAPSAGAMCSSSSAPSGSSSPCRWQTSLHITERARNVRQIAGFAVAMPQPREDADALEVTLHAHQVEPAQELRVVGTGGTPESTRRSRKRSAHARTALGPGHVAVPQQRDQVVA